MPTALDRLIELLDLEELEVNIFRGRSPQEDRQRVFGGQVAGQALVAAGRTVDRGVAHSLHAYFLRPGDPTVPILYDVDRIRDGRSFTTRRVRAIQHGHAIFNMSVSFHKAERGLEHQVSMPEVPNPDSLPTWEERMRPILEKAPAESLQWIDRERPIDIRHVDPVDPFHPEKRAPRDLVWMRADGRLPDDPMLHQCVVAYASDLTLLDSTLLPHGIAWSDRTVMMASLDHAMWFHRSFRADEWLLYVQESSAAAGARGFATGQLFSHDGTLVGSVAQEGLVRLISDPS